MIGRSAATLPVRVERYRAGTPSSARDALAVEEPLEVRVSWTDPGGARGTDSVAVTMRTPGHDFELAAGFLHGEGVVRRADDLAELTYCTGGEQQEYNVVEARLRAGVAFDPEPLRRNVYMNSSCGVCGKASLEAVEAIGCSPLDLGDLRVAPDLVPELPELLREGQGVFDRTGGIHAAGLFDAQGKCEVLREDVGRHNAVDKVVGHSLLARRLPAADGILVVSGRASFELVQKAVAGGIPVLVAVGAPSSLAAELAGRFNQTLVGFARDGGFNVYSVPERIA